MYRSILIAFVLVILVVLLVPSRATYQAANGTDVLGAVEEVDERPARVDAYFEKRSMPLAGYGEMFVEAADQYGIDWRLLPAISVKESTGGRHKCGNNPFGWGSCRLYNFGSIQEAIDVVSRNLGGHNPSTTSYYNGDTEENLWSYNGTVDPTYPGSVLRIMEDF